MRWGGTGEQRFSQNTSPVFVYSDKVFVCGVTFPPASHTYDTETQNHAPYGNNKPI